MRSFESCITHIVFVKQVECDIAVTVGLHMHTQKMQASVNAFVFNNGIVALLKAASYCINID